MAKTIEIIPITLGHFKGSTEPGMAGGDVGGGAAFSMNQTLGFITKNSNFKFDEVR